MSYVIKFPDGTYWQDSEYSPDLLQRGAKRFRSAKAAERYIAREALRDDPRVFRLIPNRRKAAREAALVTARAWLIGRQEYLAEDLERDHLKALRAWVEAEDRKGKKK